MQLGHVIDGKYRLLRLLGDGGMGAVYEAHHEVLGARVAIKVLHDDLAKKPELVDCFLREARVLAQISNPHVVRVLDIAMADSGRSAYIVMELLSGEPLSALLAREHRLPQAVAVDFAVQVLDALAAAHALGVVHRDLKPENVFITREGERTVLKLIDFGIAKAGSLGGASANLTVSGALMGTPEYMAPEQARSADRADARSDLFAVGVMLYEMLSGARPVDGEDPRVVAVKVERGDVKPLIHRMPEIPRDLAGLVHRAMAPRPELRFASAIEMRQALEVVVGVKRSSMPPASQIPSLAAPLAPTSVASPVASPDPARGTGTMFGEQASGARPPAFASPPGHVAGSQAPPYPPPPRASRRGSGGTLWLVVGLMVMLGGSVAVAVALSRSSSRSAEVAQDPPASTPVTTASAPAIPETAPSTAPQVDDPLGPLPTAAPPAHPIVTPPPRGSASGMPSSASSAHPPVPDTPFGVPPFTFPSGLPTAFPNPFPDPASSGVGPVITIPTSFPTFGLPPTPAPSATPPTPRHSGH